MAASRATSSLGSGRLEVDRCQLMEAKWEERNKTNEQETIRWGGGGMWKPSGEINWQAIGKEHEEAEKEERREETYLATKTQAVGGYRF